MLKKNDSTPGFVVDTPSIQWLQSDWSDLPAYWRAIVGTISAQIYLHFLLRTFGSRLLVEYIRWAKVACMSVAIAAADLFGMADTLPGQLQLQASSTT